VLDAAAHELLLHYCFTTALLLQARMHPQNPMGPSEKLFQQAVSKAAQ
jgi:hypothetical protein